ncbi:hypothetical protein [Blastococcus brunescens]|uniref:Uncharacterized protein n=1 Tax=Blastococcus brunescens TaxID=1564165 RepID=A0ABZ1AYA1_9ACTN|nr:hypothetical protein [Blastococcus sp. BMG 8361]WRL62408.1 hypothetical protein U6N30_20610 [Blastococcus sp. BMG 8361]
MTGPRRPAGDDIGTGVIDGLAATLRELAASHGDGEQLLEQGLAAVAELQRQLGAAVASLHTAEEVVVRQKALLETATEMISEARRWARSLWDDGPASEEPVVLNEPEFAPAWLTADGPRHPARPPDTLGGVEAAAATHELRLAALDRLIADVEEEWGPITAEEIATAAERLRMRAQTEA